MPDQTDPLVELIKESNEQTALFRAASEKIRSRADAWGKTLITVGTGVTAAAGLAKTSDIFPLPPGWWWTLAVLNFVLLTVMAAAAVVAGWRLNRVLRPISLKPDPGDSDLSEDEEKTVKAIFEQQAGLNKKGSLREYDDEALQIYQAWENRKGGDPEPATSLLRAMQIRAEVNYAMQRASTTVLRARYDAATTGKVPLVCIVAFLLAAFGVGVTLDKLEAVRTAESTQTSNRLTTIKQCADAQAGKAANPSISLALPPDCFG